MANGPGRCRGRFVLGWVPTRQGRDLYRRRLTRGRRIPELETAARRAGAALAALLHFQTGDRPEHGLQRRTDLRLLSHGKSDRTSETPNRHHCRPLAGGLAQLHGSAQLLEQRGGSGGALGKTPSDRGQLGCPSSPDGAKQVAQLLGAQPSAQLTKQLNQEGRVSLRERGLECRRQPEGVGGLARAPPDPTLLDQAIPLERRELRPDGVVGHAKLSCQLVDRAGPPPQERDQPAAGGLEETLVPWVHRGLPPE